VVDTIAQTTTQPLPLIFLPERPTRRQKRFAISYGGVLPPDRGRQRRLQVEKKKGEKNTWGRSKDFVPFVKPWKANKALGGKWNSDNPGRPGAGNVTRKHPYAEEIRLGAWKGKMVKPLQSAILRARGLEPGCRRDRKRGAEQKKILERRMKRRGSASGARHRETAQNRGIEVICSQSL